MADTKITFDIEFNNKGFNKGFSSIEKQLGDMSATLSKTSNNMSKIFDGSVQKNADKLTGKLSKQVYNINKVNNELKKMKEEYENIASGDVVPQSLITLGSQAKRVSGQMRREAIKNDRLVKDLAIKTIGVNIEKDDVKRGVSDGSELKLLESEKAKLEQDLEASTFRLNELTMKTKELNNEMMSIRMNPEVSKEAVNLSSKIQDSEFKLTNLSSEANKTNNELKNMFGINNTSLSESFSRVKSDMSELRTNSLGALNSITSGFSGISNEASKVGGSFSNLRASIGDMASVLMSQFSGVTNSIGRVSGVANKTGSNISKSASKASRNVIKSGTKAVKSLSKGLLSVGGLTDKVGSKMVTFAGRIARIAKAAFIFNVFRRGFASMRDHMGSLISTNSHLSNSLATVAFNLKVAFQPIWDFIIPALTTLISYLNYALQYLGKFTAMLFGTSYEGAKSSVKALEAQKKATEDATKATKKAGKEAKKTNDKQLQGFDQLNKMARKNEDVDTSGSDLGVKDPGVSGPSIIEVKEKDLNVKVLEKFKKALDSIKKALEPTIKALKRLWNDGLKPLGRFTWKALEGFYKKFLVPVGKWVLGEGLPRFIDAITEQLAKVDWDNLNASLDVLWEALAPFSILIGEGLLWFWENVLMPLMGWALDNLLPVAIELLAAAIEFLQVIVEAALPTLEWLWVEFFKPLGEWAGEVIINLIEGLTQKLKDLSEWARNNQATMDLIFSTIIGFFSAVILYHTTKRLVKVIGTIAGAISKFGSIVGMMLSPVGLAAIAVGALAAAFIYIGSNWGKLNGAQRAATILGGLATAAIAAGIAIAAFHASWTVGVAAAVIAGSLAAIGIAYGNLQRNASISSSQGMPSMSGGTSSAQSQSDARPSSATRLFSQTGSNYKLPMLAKGGLIPPRKPRQVIVGDNMTEDEIVSPVSTMKSAVRDVIGEMGGVSNDAQTVNILMQILRAIEDGHVIELNDREFGRSVVRAAQGVRGQTGQALF